MKLNYKKTIGLGVVILITLLVWIKWDIWFYNPPEPLYSPSANPGRIMLTWSGNSLNSRDVTWEGDTSTHVGFLQLSNVSIAGDTILYTTNSKIIKTTGGASAFFKVQIKALKEGETYRYRVANGKIWSDWAQFKIAKSADASYSFLYFGDVQDTINGVSGNLFQRAVEKRPNAAFMMFIGDMIERPHDAYWAEWFRSGGNLFRTIPVIATPGNHEYYKSLIGKLDPRWMAHFSFPQNGPKNFLGRACYWDYQNTRYISIDSNGIQSIPSALEQRSWLKSVLEASHQRWIVVMMHHPPYSTSRGHNYFFLRALFKPLIDRYNVDLVISGHDHAYGRALHIENKILNNKQGAAYVVAHASPKFYEIGFSDKMDKLASNTPSYQLFDVSNDSIRFEAYTRNGICFDGFTIRKDANGLRTVTEPSHPNNSDYLKPTELFLRKSSKKEIEKFYREMEAWEKSKKNL